MSRNLILIYILLTIIYIGAPFTARAAGAEVEINFNGELVSTTCQISASSVKKDIVLENLRRKTINETGTSDTTLFSIGIDKCSQTDLQKDVKLTWKSNKLVTIGEQDFIATDGESGVLLGVVDNDNKPVLWNTPSSIGAISIAENEQKFNFGVFVRKPVTGEAKVGNFTSIITFSVEYQ